MTGAPASDDRMDIYLLGHLQVIETVLMLMWNEHPRRAQIKADVERVLQASEANGLASTTSEEELAIRSRAFQAALAAVFVELPPASPNDAARIP